MASKYERLKARVRGMTKKAQQGVESGINAAETVGSCALVAYATGRLSDAEGNFGYKGVPYVLVGAGVLYLAAMFSPEKTQSHVLAVANGTACAHVGRVAYEMGVTSKNQSGTAGRTRGQLVQNVQFGTGYDMYANREKAAA